MLKDYIQRALENLGNIHVLEPNNIFTLRKHENVKWMLISRNFEGLIQGSCSLTKQCNLFQHMCICEKDVAKLSRSLEEP
jgi:hypothetical protein